MFWRFECQDFQTGNEALRRVTVDSLDYVIFFRAAFKFGQGVHFA